MATNYTLTPSPWQTFFYASGAPVASGQLYTYLAGTTTPATTYLNSSGTPNTNPIILDSAGRAVIYLAVGSYRFDLYDSVANGGALIKTEDNISAVPAAAAQPVASGVAGTSILAGQAVYLSDGSGGLTAGRWYLAQANNAYSSTKPEVGFALTDATIGSTISVIQTGQVLSGVSVTTGLGYYIDAVTPGSITATAPILARYMGQADSVTSMIVGNAPPSQPLVLTSVASGAQNNFNPGLNNFSAVTVLRMNNASLVTITGIIAGFDGQRLIIESIGAGQVDLVNNSGSSSAANKLKNVVTSGNSSLAAGVGRAEYVYDLSSTVWRLLTHEQGAAIAVPYSAGNFTASAGTFTVPPGAYSMSYYLRGIQLTISFAVANASVSNAFAILTVAIPSGYTCPELRFFPAVVRGSDNGTTVLGMMSPFPGTAMNCYSTYQGGGWQAQANTLQMEFDVTFFVS